MKKNLLYFSVLIALAVVTYYAIFDENKPSFDKKEANFTVENIDEVQTIFLTDMKGRSIKLDRQPDRWSLNDSLDARQDAIDFMFEALRKQRPVQKVSSGFHDAAILELSGNATKVEIYNKKGEKTHAFYVAQNPGYNNATYMLNEGASRPFVVDIPPQNLYLGLRYFTDQTEWKSRRLLYDSSPIESIRVSYKDSVQHSFDIIMENDKPRLSGQGAPALPVNQKELQKYVEEMNSLFCVGYENKYPQKQEIIHNGIQLGTIALKRKSGKEYTLNIYFKPADKRTKYYLQLGKEKYDHDIFFAWHNEKDFVQVRRKTVQKMAKSFFDFYITEEAFSRLLNQPVYKDTFNQ